MNLRPELFTTNEKEGWIHIKSIKNLKNMCIEDCNKEEPTIFIILTGWNDKYNRNLPFYFVRELKLIFFRKCLIQVTPTTESWRNLCGQFSPKILFSLYQTEKYQRIG
jgi:hypothetical protein